MHLLLFPDKSQRELAKMLGYTEGWLSTLINSDMFQERFKKLRDTYHSTAFIGLRSKTEAAASMAVDRLVELMENDQEKALSPSFILEATTKLLSHMEKYEEPPKAPSDGFSVNITLAGEIQNALVAVNNAREQIAQRDDSQGKVVHEVPYLEQEEA